MKKLAMLAIATAMAFTAAVADSRPAAAHRNGAVVAGIIGGIALGAILAHKYKRDRRRAYYYRTDRPYYYSGGYYRPYSYTYAPRRHYRVYKKRSHKRYRW